MIGRVLDRAGGLGGMDSLSGIAHLLNGRCRASRQHENRNGEQEKFGNQGSEKTTV